MNGRESGMGNEEWGKLEPTLFASRFSDSRLSP